jgi:hypothetical protein
MEYVWSVTTDGLWIYWTLWYSTWLHLQYTITHNSVHSHVFTSRCSVPASNGGRSASSGYPNYSRPQLPASQSKNSQRLNLSSSLTHSLTNQLTQHNWLTELTQLLYWLQHIGTNRTENTVPLLPFTGRCLVMVVVELFVSWTLLSNIIL